MLASMSEIDRHADTPLVDWSDLGVSGLLPTGTVTLLLADVEGSTRLWETQPEAMTAAFARLDRELSDLISAHGGVRPVEQGPLLHGARQGLRQPRLTRRQGRTRFPAWQTVVPAPPEKPA